MLDSGGITNVATVVLGSDRSFGSGRRSFHMGSIFIRLALSSYLSRPCSDKNFENSVNLLAETPSCSDSSSILCHAPSLMTLKNFSIVTSIILLLQAVIF